MAFEIDAAGVAPRNDDDSNAVDARGTRPVAASSPVYHRIRSRGARIRQTYSRSDVLRVIAKLGPRAISRAEVFRRLKLAGSGISLSSVYRMMDELERDGAILCEWTPEREARYRIKPNDFDACRLRITCASSGRSVALNDRALLTRLLAIASQHGFETTGGAITFELGGSAEADADRAAGQS